MELSCNPIGFKTHTKLKFQKSPLILQVGEQFLFLGVIPLAGSGGWGAGFNESEINELDIQVSSASLSCPDFHFNTTYMND